MLRAARATVTSENVKTNMIDATYYYCCMQIYANNNYQVL